MLNARAAALVAGIVLTLGSVSQANQANFCVVSVDKGAGTLTVVPANDDDKRARHMVGDHNGPQSTVTLVPKTNYVHARTHPNTDQHMEWYYTQAEFLDAIQPGDVIEVDGPPAGPSIIWLSRWQY